MRGKGLVVYRPSEDFPRSPTKTGRASFSARSPSMKTDNDCYVPRLGISVGLFMLSDISLVGRITSDVYGMIVTQSFRVGHMPRKYRCATFLSFEENGK